MTALPKSEETAAEDLRNVLQLLDSPFFAWQTDDYNAVVRLVRAALAKLEGTEQ